MCCHRDRAHPGAKGAEGIPRAFHIPGIAAGLRRLWMRKAQQGAWHEEHLLEK